MGGVKEIKLTTGEVDVHGDTAIETGDWTITVQPPGAAEPIANADEGKYMVVWKRSHGKWLFYRDIWNSSRPPPPPPKVEAK